MLEINLQELSKISTKYMSFLQLKNYNRGLLNIKGLY